jgi:hypothetical protein
MPMFLPAIGASLVSGTTIWQSMFGFEIPATEKILRNLVVYLGLAVIMRLAGKRQRPRGHLGAASPGRQQAG